jgi:queuine tRNA-ribosyltransferase
MRVLGYHARPPIMSPISFQILARDGAARRGVLSTGRGPIDTPAFMPVGTLGAVKGVAPWDLETAGAQVMLCNLYHLSVRPGVAAIERLGGLHRWNGWPRPILTDSGGFQVMSLAGLRAVREDGVDFRSHLDGALLRFTPESVVADQERLGVDIAMVLDECPPWPAPLEIVRQATLRTERWAQRAREAWKEGSSALFAIAQGGVDRGLREATAARLAELDFPGYAIGGVSVGEPEALRHQVVGWTAPLLPEDRPRYLMGVGTPLDLVRAARAGVDLFDCVLPARNARHGLLFTWDGPLRLKNAAHGADDGPIDRRCGCPVCTRLGRAFLSHLHRAGEITAATLATLHNLHFYLDFMAELRKAIESGQLASLEASVRRAYGAVRASEAPEVDAGEGGENRPT